MYPNDSAANERTLTLCEGTAICTKSEQVFWGLGTTGTVTLDAAVGCPTTAYYQVTGFNARGSEEVVARITPGVPQHILTFHQRYRFFQITPSDATGCSNLHVSLVMMHR